MGEMITFPEIARAESWRGAHEGFAWNLPARYNIADLITDRWARAAPERLALIDLDETGREQRWSYQALSRRAAQFANCLAAHGVKQGDHVGVLLPQSSAALITWLGALKLGAVVTPLFTLFGEDALRYRLRDSSCAALVTDRENLPKIAAIRDDLPDLRLLLLADGAAAGAEDFGALLNRAKDDAATAPTGPDDPALLSYTSGTTGAPKGALHGQRVLAAHVVGARMVYDFLPHPGDLVWTPADWAWMGGSMNALAPALYHGIPVLAHRMSRFDPERAFDLLAKQNVRAACFPPTALKFMRQVERPQRFGHDLRIVVSAGESMGAETLAWGREAFGAPLNEFYGQTECNMVIGNNARLAPQKPGSMGQALPGHEAAVLGPDLQELGPDEPGELAIRAPDAGLFLRYLNMPEKTAEKLREGPDGRRWMLTGDVVTRDEEGYFRFASRTDDVITHSGYRVGPAEIEDCLSAHKAVSLAAVVGEPDAVRTETICAFIRLTPGAKGDAETAKELIAHVRARLSPHLAPSRIEFTEDIPVTATGKIMRRELRARLTGGNG